MSVETKLMTAEELLAMPDGGRFSFELVKGELITMSPAGEDHGYIAMEIGARLRDYVRKNRLGRVYSSDTGFLLSRNPDTVRQPDAAFVAAQRVVKTGKHVPVAPDLAIEVVSPNDSYAEVEQKVDEYIAAGTRMVIVINPPNRTAIVTTPAGIRKMTVEDTLTGGNVVPGWQLPLRELFED